MKAVIQRVLKAKVTVDDKTVAEIGPGILVLLGVRKGDDERKAAELARRCIQMRIFEDRDGKFNLSLEDVKGEAIVVSQFTLLADTRRGRRPSFSDAETPDQARRLYEYFVARMLASGIKTRSGVFGARMVVSLENNGPVTIIMEE
jgi:D-tyrosyl-tRNA(Tyr) deacylase